MKRLLATAVFLPFAGFGATTPSLDEQFTQNVQPAISKYCTGCHSGSNAAAQFDLKAYDSLAPVLRDYPRWELVLSRLTANEMPPKQMPQPPAAVRKQVIDWIQAVRAEEIRKHAGDPGSVLNRRLSNAEYNYTIRDLTGVDLRPAREFPVDPANQAGFDNSGESLTISPGLMSKYLDAARQTADHMVLKPEGIDFAPYPMLVETDRERYAIQRIVEFYDRQPTDFADYFLAAWRYKHRIALGKPRATLTGIAMENKLSARYLNMVWQLLEQTKEEVGPTVKLQAMWRELPAPKGQAAREQADAARPGCEQMRDFVRGVRRHTEKLFDPPTFGGLNANFQPFAMWRNREIEAHRRDFDPAALRVEGEPPAPELMVTRGPIFGKGEEIEVKKAIADYLKERKEDPNLVVPAGQRARYEAAFGRFSNVFPTGFYARERGRFYPIDSYDKGRLLGAGFHNVMGYYRDDSVLSDLILDEKGKKELNALWQEFDFIADYTIRTWQQFVFDGGGRGGKPIEKPTFAESTSAATINRYRDHFLEIVAPANNPAMMQAVKVHFDTINSEIRWVEQARKDAEPRHLDALLKFAARAYRRPLRQDDRDDILAYYHDLREKSNLTHEEAMRSSIVSLLVSPDFLYRADLVETSFGGAAAKAAVPAPTAATRPLSGYALANKLSYFLWSSMPDDELMSHAAAGDLSRPAVLQAEVRRMLKDDRARGLATEFGGNWLDFRHFETLNSVDRERFPKFNDGLREAMFEEPVRFITDAIQKDRPVLDMLYGKYTFVNQPLAEHYGMPAVSGGPDRWVRVDNADVYGRGGLLPMAAFLTQNSPGLRTSPVKRGYWVARRVLGEVIPPPPPVVPELPHDEAKLDLPLRELLAQHRSNPVCASCHVRFDVFGMTLENYGPVGDLRTKDLAGRAVDTHATFPGGSEGTGLAGLQTYIRGHREKDFVNNLTEKMLIYALGRARLLSDEPLLDAMRTNLAASGYKFSSMIDTIVSSPQFLNKRNQPMVSRKGD